MCLRRLFFLFGKKISHFLSSSCIMNLTDGEKFGRSYRGGDGVRWAQVSVVTTHEGADLIGNILMELGAAGTEIDDPSLVNEYIDAGLWDYTDLPRAEDTDTVTVCAYLPEDAASGGQSPDARGARGESARRGRTHRRGSDLAHVCC